MKRPRWRVLVAATLAIVALYWAIGAGVGASRVRGQLHAQLAGTTDQTLAMDRLRFNPFTLTARFEGLRLDDVDAGPVLTIAAGRLRLAFTGLFGNAFTISDLFLEQPSARVVASGPPGTRRWRSLGSLLPSADDSPQRSPIRIGHAKVDDGQVTVFDSAGSGTRSNPVGTVTGLNLELTALMSDAISPASFDLTARINDTGALAARGVWVPASHTVEADLKLNGLQLAPFAALFGNGLPDARIGGVLAAQGQFRHHAYTPGFEGELVIERLTVDDAGGQSLLSADKLTARGVKIGNGQRAATVQRVELDRPGVTLNPGFDDQFNLHRRMVGMLPRIDSASIRDGRVSYTDTRLPTAAQIAAVNIAGEMTRGPDESQETLTIGLVGDLTGQGSVTIDGVFRVKEGQLEAQGDASLSAVNANIISAYFSSFTLRDILTGTLSLDLHYRVVDAALALSSKVLLADLELSAPADAAPAYGSPLDLTVALLTDAQHRMAFELPVYISAIGSNDAIRQGFDDALTDFFTTVTAEPMTLIAQLAGLEAGAIDPIIFAAGGTEILPAAERQLAALADVFARRPLLGVRAQGHYATRADRAALARRQVGLHIALAASTRTGDPSEEASLDFSNPEVQAVLDEFATARLDETERNTLKPGAAAGDQTATDLEQSYYRAVFEALATKESISDYALRQLARYRAHSVVGRLQELGVAAQRLDVDKRVAAAVSDDVPATVALTTIAWFDPGFTAPR